jgi:hypothetical protein
MIGLGMIGSRPENRAFGGRVHVEWNPEVPVTPLGQLPFLIDYLKQGGLFDGWVCIQPGLACSAGGRPAGAEVRAP